jgi:hypothetical protein
MSSIGRGLPLPSTRQRPSSTLRLSVGGAERSSFHLGPHVAGLAAALALAPVAAMAQAQSDAERARMEYE